MTLFDWLEYIGVSAIIAIIVSCVFHIIELRSNKRFEKILLEKESRYRSILVFMSVVLDIENYNHIDTTYKPKTNDVNEIKQYYLNEILLHKEFSYLYASKEVINAIDLFIKNQTKETYRNTALLMRKDLWKNKLK